MSTKPAMTKPQLATGPQKWLVLGPTGLFRNDLSAVAMAESTPRGSWNHQPGEWREGYLVQLSPTSEGEEFGGERGEAEDLVESTSGWRMGSIWVFWMCGAPTLSSQPTVEDSS
jgi:hypothetical protein